MPKVLASHPPSSPCRPKASSSATPPTTGGRPIGSTVRARTPDRTGKVSLAKVQASGTPSTTAITVAENDASSDRRRAARPSGAPSSRHADVHGVRNSRPSSGMMKKAAPAPARRTMGSGGEGRPLGRLRVGKSIASKDPPAVGEHVADERLGHCSVLRIFEDDDGILGYHVERRCDRHALNRGPGGPHVCDVDDAPVRLVRRDLAELALHISLLTRA